MPGTIDRTSRRAWCLFHNEAGAMAVPIEAVAEVVRVERLVPVPLAPACLIGLCVLRRDVIPVIDLGCQQKQARAGPSHPVDVLMMRTMHGPWGVLIARGGTEVVEAALDERAAASDQPSGAAQTMTYAGKVHIAHDPEALWRHVRAQIEPWAQAKSKIKAVSGSNAGAERKWEVRP